MICSGLFFRLKVEDKRKALKSVLACLCVYECVSMFVCVYVLACSCVCVCVVSMCESVVAHRGLCVL